MKLEVGMEVVACDKYNGEPTITYVTKVTASGKFFYTDLTGKETKYRNTNPGADLGEWDYGEPMDKWAKWNRIYQISRLEECQKRHAQNLQNAAEKKAAKEAREAEYAARVANEMQQVKDACDNYLFGRVQSAVTLPDGSRLFTINMPVHPAYQDRKQFEILIVRVRDCKTFGLNGEIVGKEGSYTYINARESNFSSYSNIGGDNEEEIVWECMRRQYHNS